jgi:hypothetical protein
MGSLRALLLFGFRLVRDMSLPHKLQHHFAPSRPIVKIDEHDLLPGAEQEAAIFNRRDE